MGRAIRKISMTKMIPRRLKEREQELESLLALPGGREQIQELASKYYAASGKLRPPRGSAITFILVHEREMGLIREL